MGMVNVIRRLKGYVTFRAKNGKCERFFTACTAQGYQIWDIRRKDGTFFCKTFYKSYLPVARIARQYGVQMRADRRRGMPFLLRKYKKRAGLLAGAVLAIGFLLVMQGFVWKIEVLGNETISKGRILDVAAAAGVYKGAFIPKLDVKAAERKMLLKLDNIAWLSINRSGSRVTIELNEGIHRPDSEAEESGNYNLVAEKSGLITGLEVYEGQARVKPGDFVFAGDLLISGIMEDRRGVTVFKSASGKVYAKTAFNKSFSVPQKSQTKEYQKESKRRYLLYVFGVNIPLFPPPGGENDIVKETTRLRLFGLRLPIGYTKKIYRPYQTVDTVLKKENAQAILEKQFENYEQESLADETILNSGAELREEEGRFVMEKQYILNEDIAKKQEYFTK